MTDETTTTTITVADALEAQAKSIEAKAEADIANIRGAAHEAAGTIRAHIATGMPHLKLLISTDLAKGEEFFNHVLDAAKTALENEWAKVRAFL